MKFLHGLNKASLWLAGGTLAILVALGPAQLKAQTYTGASHAKQGVERGKVLFVLNTGIEDIQEMNMSLQHAKEAMASGYLEDVVWLSYGRGVSALAGSMTARPAATDQLAREAQAAGVRLIVCKSALQELGIPRERLSPMPEEMVSNGVDRLAELVSQGYQIVRY